MHPGQTCMLYVRRLPEQRKGDRFPEFLHSALHHYEPPCAPQPKSSIFFLQRAHSHAVARPDARCSHPGKIGASSSLGLVGELITKRITPPPSGGSPQKGFDVFNALDLMENKTFLEKLKFGIGDGNLQYYLYNWKCPIMGADKASPLINVALRVLDSNLTLCSPRFRLGWCCSDVPLRQKCHRQAG